MVRRKQPVAAATQPNHQEQRRHIMQALHRCIRRKGYAFTTLRDLAEEANMSASHVRYYFDGKDVVLEYYLESFVQVVRSDLDQIAELPPEERIQAVADRFFGDRVSRDRISVLFEIFGIAIHNKRLHALKASHDAHLLLVILDTLKQSPRGGGGNVEDDAHTIHALLVGFSTNMLFDAEQNLAMGRRLFLATFRQLAGYPDQ